MSNKNDEKITASESQTRYKLVSRLNYPVPLNLKDGETIFIAAHGTIDSIDPDLLDNSLPTGIHKLEFQV